jgi:tripartite-type tricarboxylate transporter receptor subunit TctC
MDNMIRRRHFNLAIGALAFGSHAAYSQNAEPWPSRPVKVIVPAGAGSGTDLFARYFCDKLAAVLGQPFVIDNKAGASGMLGSDVAAKSKPDGYTLLFSNSGFTVMLKGLVPKMSFDLEKDLIPIVQIAAGGVLLLANPALPAQNLKELIELVRANPDKYSYGTWGVGTSAHLVMEGLKNKTGMRINHVPYKTTAQVQQDLIAGVLQIGWGDGSSSLPLIKAGRIKMLTISGSQRSPNIPDVPTIAEQGYGLSNDGWYGMFAPTGTPPAVVDRINAEVNRIMQTAEWKERLLKLNAPNGPPNSSPEFTQTVQRDIKAWTQIVRDNNIKVD